MNNICFKDVLTALIKHIPSHFQRFITHLFLDMPYVYPYIDNIVFASKTWEEHEKHAQAIIERLTSVALTIKPNSVNLGNSEIRILGHLINAHGIGLDPEKKRLILSWPLPSTGADLASFLGLGTYLRDHVRHYADITAPLESIKKQKEIKWNESLKRSFELVKRAFSTAPFLKFPNFNNKFAIATDASWIGVGAVLYQPDDADDTITPNNIVAICSKKLSETQQRYPIYKKELWAIVYALRKFHSYIWGRPDTVILTDHKPLIHMLNQTNMSVALQQWLDVILGYNLKVKYRPGLLHVMPDALSRMYYGSYNKDVKSVWGTFDNIKFIEDSFKTLSPSDKLCELSMQELVRTTKQKVRHREAHKTGGGKAQTEDEEGSINSLKSLSLCVQNIKCHSYSDDEFYNFDKEDVTNTSPAFTVEDEWEFENSIQQGALCYAASVPYQYNQQVKDTGVLTNADRIIRDNENESFDRNAKVYDEKGKETTVSENAKIDPYRLLTVEDKLALAQEKRGCSIPPENQRAQIIKQAHERGHFGVTAIFRELSNKKIWWPKMMDEITSTIKQCRACQEYTIVRKGYHPMQSVHASQPGDHLMIDLIQMIESTDHMRYILTVIDVFTGFVLLFALPDKSAETIAAKLWEVICLIGPPKIIQSDAGSEFVNAIITALMRHQGIKHVVITPYHPESDGKVERCNGTVRVTINKMVMGLHVHWPLFLSFVQLSINTKISELTQSTPFALMFARRVNDFTDYTQTEIANRKVSLDDWKQHQEEVLSLIYPQIELRSKAVQQQYRERLAKIRRNVLTRDLPPGTQVMILDEKYLKGTPKPNTEPKYIGKYTIVKREVNGPYVVKDMTGELLARKVPIEHMKVLFRPGLIPAMQDDEDVWVVEKILNHKLIDGVTHYEIKWKGFGYDDTTWEPRENIHDQNLIDVYWRKHEGTKQSKKQTKVMFASLSLVSSRQCSLFDEADQTARTHNMSFKQKLKSYEM
jgi:transposase InsO family protein